MNRTADLDLVLREYLADDGGSARDYVLDVVADRISHQPQRRAWRLHGRPIMTTQIKLIAAAAAAVVLAVAGWNLLPRTGSIGGPPTAPPSVAPSPSATARPSPTLGSGALPSGKLAAGHYTLTPPIDALPGLTVAADIPADWRGYPEIPALTAPSDSESRQVGGLIGFMPGEGLFSDPCHWNVDGTGSTDQSGDVEIGPSVDDLVAALQANTSYTASEPRPITIGGFEGKVVDLQLPGDDVLSTCDGDPAQQGDHKFIVLTKGFWSQGPDSRWRLFILDVNGTRLVTMISSFGSLPQAELDAAQAIVASFVITT
jgi:hypothetical protein